MLTLREYFTSCRHLSLAVVAFIILNTAFFFVIKKLYSDNQKKYISFSLHYAYLQLYFGITVFLTGSTASAFRELLAGNNAYSSLWKIPVLLFIIFGFIWIFLINILIKILRIYENKMAKLQKLRFEINGENPNESADIFKIKFSFAFFKESASLLYIMFFLLIISFILGFYFSS